jgi:hypothetical protein
MTPEEFATCWVPVPLRWRHVVAGDVIAGKGGHAWLVEQVPPFYVLNRGAERYPGPDGKRHPVDPDEVVQVLTPVPMAQAMALTRAELGTQVIERRNTIGGAA